MFILAKKIISTLSGIDKRLSSIQEALGRIETRQNGDGDFIRSADQDFKVYSQWGEDGIIQFLIRHVAIKNDVFVEFGVENYRESNTRFLLVNNNWSGLVIDGNPDNIDYIKSDSIYWRYNIKADCAFVTRENINTLLKRNGVIGDIGLLSIDVDGNDYWIWKEVEVISPRIVVIEYNFRFGFDKSVTVPYKPDFVRQKSHYSMIYFGASLKALVNLGQRKGYAFVGCNKNGVNAFFVRTDVLGEIKEKTIEEGYVAGKFRESRNKDGKLAFMNIEDEIKMLDDLPLINIDD